MSKIVLIDGKNFAYRHHYTNRILSSNGRPTSVLYGALAGLLSLNKRLPDTPLVFVWDGQGKTWRHTFEVRYKANRVYNEDARTVNEQLPLFKSCLFKMGLRQFEIENLEGDDLLGLLSRTIAEKGWFDEIVIHSTDKDYYQLVSDKIKVLRYPERVILLRILGRGEVEEEIGMSVKDSLKIKAIVGEKTDNIPHLFEGVGPKTAANWVSRGVDPSVSEWAMLGKFLRSTFSHLRNDWPAIHRNYILSQIVCHPDNPNLPAEMQKTLGDLIVSLTKEDFLRDRKKCADDAYDVFTNFLLEYELSEIWTQRETLWNLP